MRSFNAPPHSFDTPPDTVGTVLLTTSGQSVDYPSGTDIIRFAVAQMSSVGVFIADGSTAARVATATTGGSTAAASRSVCIPGGQIRTMQVLSGSTGFSVVASVTGGYMTYECWKVGG